MATVIDNANSIFGGFLEIDASAGDGPLTIKQGGVVRNTSMDGDGVIFTSGKSTATIDGTVIALDGYGMVVTSEANGTKIAIGETGSVVGDISGIGGSGNQTIINKGFVGGLYAVYSDAAALTVTNSGIIEGTSRSINYNGTGNFVLKNTGTLFGNVGGGNNAAGFKDDVTNSGHIEDRVFLGSGNDKFINSGTVNDDVDMGDGNDTFKNTGTVNGLIDLGGGNDIFTGGALGEYVKDATGADKYTLGDGIDTFDGNGETDDNEIDTVDGGANKGTNIALGIYGDVYDTRSVGGNVRVNLDTVKHSDSINFTYDLEAGEARGGDIGQDFIKNFEVVFTGTGNDTVYGNKSANLLNTDVGDDTLFGFDGDDQFQAGDGKDLMVGGKGRDLLNGNTLNFDFFGEIEDYVGDGDIDRYYYDELSDSTVAIKGRDVIQHFEDGFDIIDFRGLGLFAFNPTPIIDNKFTPTASEAEVRVLTHGLGWLVELDANGDGKADLAIEINGTGDPITWSTADFDFV